jgi:hypothetical protein
VPVKTLKDLEIVSEPSAAKQVRQMEKNCKDSGLSSCAASQAAKPRHRCTVDGPRAYGATSTPARRSSAATRHTSTHGASARLAVRHRHDGVGHVLRSKCLLSAKP